MMNRQGKFYNTPESKEFGDNDELKPLYKPFISTAKNKKYAVYVMKDGRKKLIHFGDLNYQHFYDKLGHYSYLNHNDEQRRARYRWRHSKLVTKKGKDFHLDINQPAYWSYFYLW